MVTVVTTAQSFSETSCTTLLWSRIAFRKIQGKPLLGVLGRLRKRLFRCARDEMRMEMQLLLIDRAVVPSWSLLLEIFVTVLMLAIVELLFQLMVVKLSCLLVGIISHQILMSMPGLYRTVDKFTRRRQLSPWSRTHPLSKEKERINLLKN